MRLNALAILTAWMHKQRTGEGQYIDMAQSEAALHFLAPECHRYFTTGEVSEPCGNRDVQFAPQGVYPAAGNDRWIAISVQSDAAWAALCQLLGWSALGDLSLAERHQRHDELDERLASWCSTQDGLRLEQLLQQHGVAAHRVMDTHDLYSDAQLQHRGHYLSVHHRDYAPAVVESSRLSFSRTAAQRPERAPWFGCDNETVLREVLGYDAQQLASLVDGGVLR